MCQVVTFDFQRYSEQKLHFLRLVLCLFICRGGPTASRDSREIAFAFHVYIQKSIEERFPGVSIPLEVQAWVLYCVSAMRCEDD